MRRLNLFLLLLLFGQWAQCFKIPNQVSKSQSKGDAEILLDESQDDEEEEETMTVSASNQE